MRKRSAQRTQKVRKRKWFVLAFLVLFAIFLVWLGLQARSSVFFRSQRVVLALQDDPVTLVVLPSSDLEPALRFQIPGDVEMTVPFGYGTYRLGAVGQLGSLEKKPELFTQTLADFFGVAIDGRWNGGTSFGELVLGTNDTNLNTLDRVLLFWKLGGLNSSSARTYDLSQIQNLLSTKQELGATSQIVNAAVWEQFLEDKLELEAVRLEGAKVKVINTTEVPGVGSKLARYVNHAGATVIGLANAQEVVPRCLVRVLEGEERKEIVRYLVATFDCDVQTAESVSADVEVRVGDFFATRWK